MGCLAALKYFNPLVDRDLLKRTRSELLLAGVFPVGKLISLEGKRYF